MGKVAHTMEESDIYTHTTANNACVRKNKDRKKHLSSTNDWFSGGLGFFLVWMDLVSLFFSPRKEAVQIK